MVKAHQPISPEQPFSWNCPELFVKQLSLVSRRVGLEITGNQERLSITLLCHSNDVLFITTAFSSKLKFCRLSLTTEELIFDTEPQVWEDVSIYDYFPPPPYHHLLNRPNELQASPYEALITAIANITRRPVKKHAIKFPISKSVRKEVDLVLHGTILFLSYICWFLLGILTFAHALS